MKSIAFYLPQFHPIEENDRWWGEGFTEWRNVDRARPMFAGHRQPQVPGELGYYDLRQNEARHKQARLAKTYGIDAFCYYHYWFSGKRLLETPLEMLLADKSCDFPFCLCWANETWSRAWDGREREILIAQEYSDEDDVVHARHLCEIFKDPRYLKSQGKPVFIIYRVGRMPNPKHFVDSLKKAAVECGLPGVRVFAVRNSACNVPDEKLKEFGIEDIVDFQPCDMEFPRRCLWGKGVRFGQRLWNRFARRFKLPEMNSVLRLPYQKVSENVLALYRTLGANHHPVVFPNWDNSPRRKAATIIQNDDPKNFENWVRAAAEIVRQRPEEDQFLFVNAWNEWAESAHLEPEQVFGNAFLEAFQKGAGR